MDMTVLEPLLGGVLIGAASVLVLASQRRVIGISGIVGRLLEPQLGDAAWRVAFVIGLLACGAVTSVIAPERLSVAGVPGFGPAIVAGVLVGIGTRLGNGCTSGHGVCGVSRLSLRSLAATMVFMLTGAVTVYVTHHMLNGAS